MAVSVLVSVSGLVIHADAPIHGLRPLDVPQLPDVWVRMRGSLETPSLHGDSEAWYLSPYLDDRAVPLMTIHSVRSGFLLTYAEGARFLVNASGSSIDAWWDPPLTDADAADYLLCSVLAFVVRLRGMVPLHASAVVVQEQAILFAGAAGAGKSCLAAAFAILGYPVLSDDLVALDDSSGLVLACPNRARVSVWPDSADRLFSSTPLPAHSPVYAKRCLDLVEHGYRIHERPVPVGMICVLASRQESNRPPAIRTLRPQTALMNLVSHTYGNYLLDASMRAREFDVLGRIAESVCVSELSLSADLDALVSDCRWLVGGLALQSAAQTT